MVMLMAEKKVKKKISFKGLIVVLLGLYLVLMVIYVIFRMPISNIVVKGNNLTTDAQIISASSLKNTSSIWQSLSLKVKNNIKELDLISDVKIHFNLLGKITIKVTEEIPLFYYERNNSYILSNNNEIKTDAYLNGIPTLINFVPSDILSNFVLKLKDIDTSVLRMISEIKYDPDTRDGITIDDSRFLLKMNDENAVYVNVVNLEKLEKYKEIIASLGSEEKGVLFLDSNLNNTYFETYAKIKADKEKEVDENELPDETNGASE